MTCDYNKFKTNQVGGWMILPPSLSAFAHSLSLSSSSHLPLLPLAPFSLPLLLLLPLLCLSRLQWTVSSLGQEV